VIKTFIDGQKQKIIIFIETKNIFSSKNVAYFHPLDSECYIAYCLSRYLCCYHCI